MKLSKLIKEIELKKIIGDLEVDISNLQIDSRKVESGSCFLAVKGRTVDGHMYINEAIEKGASAVVLEDFPQELNENVTYIQVESVQKIVGLLASSFYNHPSRKMKLIGVSGTNGKTTIITLLYNFFELFGHKAGLIGTVENYSHTKKIESTHTTPDAISINKLLNEMVDDGCYYVFMEVSSHAIDQGRINGLEFAGGIFTNLTHEHLDYHGTKDKYLETKKKFYDSLPKNSFALINKDDEHYPRIIKNISAKLYTYSLSQEADFKAQVSQMNLLGTNIFINKDQMHSNLMGIFNVYNTVAVFATALLLGVSKDDILKIMPKLKPVRGRLELVRKNNILGVVDYAHTPDALQKVLETINELKNRDQKVICVVGAGGDRDSSKRPIMAKITHDLAEVAVLTSDNPRSEDPSKILEDMIKGVPGVPTNRLYVIQDRKEAIYKAVLLAKPNGVVVIAGKGHETYQEISGVRYPFNDREVLEEALNKQY